jgi:hypothetical protein
MTTRTQAALGAIARVLRPVIRLALAFGVKYQQLDGLVRDLLIEEATRNGQGRRRKSGLGKPGVNVSQLSVTTGMSRVEIKERTRTARAALPATEMSYAAKTFTHWLQRSAADPSLRSIPVTSTVDEVTFESLARTATRGNVHHRAVLTELTRLKMAALDGDKVTLLAPAFVPNQDEQAMLSFLADNTRDHLNAAVSNVIGNEPPFLERVVFSQGVAERDCIAAMDTMRLGWNRIHGQLVDHLTQSNDQVGADPQFRIRLGVYAYYEPWSDADVPLDSDDEEHDNEPDGERA